MDFAKLDLRAASERGSWVHLSYNGEKLFEGDKPQRIKVRGMGAKGVMEAFRRVERVQALRGDRLARASEKAADGVLAKFQEELEEAMGALIVSAVSELDNIIWDGEPLECTPENVLKFCGPGTLFFGQVNSAIAEEHRLFTEADSAL